LAERRKAGPKNFAHLARGHLEMRVAVFVRQHLDRCAGRARQFAALAGTKFYVMDLISDRNVPKKHAVAGLELRGLRRNDLLPNLHAMRRKDVGDLTILVTRARDKAGAIRVVLDCLYLRRNV